MTKRTQTQTQARTRAHTQTRAVTSGSHDDALARRDPRRATAQPDGGALRLAVALGAALLGERGAGAWSQGKDGLRALALRDPIDSLAAVVLGGAWAFWQAERGHNPKCQTYFDALAFVSTCLSVGYDQVFAQTPAGKAIATAVMTFGPALAAAALDPPAAQREREAQAAAAGQRAVVERLDAIVAALERRGEAAAEVPRSTT